jgi:coenzyme F420 hydrogenase subunit beta
VRLNVVNIRDVAETQMCCGCGACAYVSPDDIEMVDTLDYGRRPLAKNDNLSDPRSAEALAACPGPRLEHRFDPNQPGLIKELTAGWGPILEVWEGHAADPEIRFAGSSGGAASALAVYGFERGGMHGVLHIAARPDVPYLNHTVLSRTRSQVLAACGSRYAPASPCDGLKKVEEAPAPCVFIGKPCDVAGAANAAALRPALAEKLGLTIGIFCAGTPSTKGTLELMKKSGIDPTQVRDVRYRGNGWPGNWVVRTHPAGPVNGNGNGNGSQPRSEMTYEKSWGELQKYRQWRCYVCADHTGEFADIAVGDPWYRPIPPGDPGWSLVLVRTERGRKFLQDAMAAGYLTLRPAEPQTLVRSQPNLLRTRGDIWARIWVSRLFGAVAPRYRGMPQFRFWLSELSLKQKLQSVYGTAKRVFVKRLRKRHPVVPYEAPRPSPADSATAQPVRATTSAATSAVSV